MSTILLLIQKRENLLLELAGLNHDLNEYSKNPVETVDLLGLKHQHDFTIREIKKIGQQINIFFNSQISNYKQKFFEVEKKITEAISKKEFTIHDLPKNHYSLWQDSEN
ncbi:MULTISPECIES: hypothetical protein [Flavobacterium]|jgi:uncharacterized protein Yka (UPF0111/DUF47 family)|uniref:hypothetical protein n=1 Tax=Flavobacterium TaxID=237 RepID=UPI0011825564|nr:MULTISPECIES: hypothetical protein [Flavobacterium]MBP1224490.1 uncharacterized protein Yka (UPF0111/DUF47 family) [Flavobacterium sp. 1355]